MKKFPIKTVFLITCALFITSTVHAASIKGNIVYDGDLPKFKAIKMDADPICLTHNTEEVLPQTLVVGEGNTMGNVFVHITRGVPKKNYVIPQEAATISQSGCMYDPHVLGLMVGQPIKFLNPDGTLHNVHALPKLNKEFNLAMPKFRKETTKQFDKAEFMFPIKCDVHPWMGAWVAVMDHPYFMVTKEDGNFILADLPAGEYEIQAWHEKLPTQKQSVVLAEGETKEINFVFSRPKKK